MGTFARRQVVLLPFPFSDIAVNKRRCRYCDPIDPVATAEHINAYREMWDMPDRPDMPDDVAGGGV